MSPLPAVAQTNLQLYSQLRAQAFVPDALASVHAAYLLAAQQTAGSLRGSGKPFVCHLVGTASLVAMGGGDAVAITAALLHALYQDRVPGADDLAARRAQILASFGEDCEHLLFAYYRADTGEVSAALPRSRARDLQTLQLADTLEDALDLGLLLHGAVGDDVDRRGGARWRLQRLATEEAQFCAQANALGLPMFAERYRQGLQEARQLIDHWILHTGAYSTYVVRPT